MPDKFTRFGEFFMQGLAKTLAEGTAVDVPHVGECKVSHVFEPRLHQSSWSMNLDISFPESYSNMTIGMFTFGSCLMKDTEAIKLPVPTYSNEEDDARQKEHMEAWYRLLESLENGLEAMGCTIGSSDSCDIYLVTDYMPSDGVSALVLKPSVLRPELIRLCQELLRQEAKWNFWIRLSFDFPKDRHNGFEENILVRPDRVVHDYDAGRLAMEFPGEVPVLDRKSDEVIHTPDDLELFTRINEVLHYVWDPIGVSGIVKARDEYDMYVPQVVGLLNSKATSKEVAAFLTRIETERMGLMPNPERADRAAALACQWFNDLMSKGAQTS